MPVGCLPLDTETLVAAAVAAAGAVSATLAAKHRPAGALTRASDRARVAQSPSPADEDLRLGETDDGLAWAPTWYEGDEEPETEWPARRPVSRVGRALHELRSKHHR